MIRLVLVIPTLDRSGAEKQLALLAAHLPRDQFDVHVVALTRGGPYESDLQQAGIPVTVLHKRVRFDPQAAWRLRRLLRSLRADIVHSWLFAANTYVRLVAPRGNPRSRLIASERCVDSWKADWQLAFDRRLIGRTDRLIANSQAVAAFYRDVGYRDDQVVVIPNAVDVPPVPAATREQICRNLGLPGDAKLVAYVGRLAPQKRLQDLIWAAQLLRQADSRARLVIFGDGPERDTLIHYARQVEVSEYVRFVGPRGDAASLLHRMDVFWLASDFEGLSNSLMEAMACGKPVVVSNIPPNRELVTHGREGYLIDVGDSVGFAQFTRKLFDDPHLAEQLGQAGRSRMLAEFSCERMVQRHVAAYQSVARMP